LAACVVVVGLPHAGAAQQRAAAAGSPGAAESSFTVFVQARPIGSEQIAVTRGADGWTITSSGRLNAPVEIVTRRLEVRYDTDWKPLELTLDATVGGQSQMMHTIVRARDGSIASEVAIAGQPSRSIVINDIDAAVLIPNPFFASYEAVTARLQTAVAGSTMSAYAPPAQVSLSIRVGESTNERIQTAAQTIETKHTHVTITAAAAGAPPVEMDLWADPNGRLLRLSVPMQALEVVREDITSVAARQVFASRSNDEQVKIPANGFVLAGTLSKPLNAGTMRLPAVVLVSGSGPADRDEVVSGIPIFGQLADAIADEGFVVLRYDKRGIGQSGGRPEAAALADYADDARAAVRFLSDRRNVDPKRIALVGYSEGGSVAMFTGAREKRVAALVLIATIGVTGAEAVLDQVRHGLDRTSRSDADKQAIIELQRKIQRAVLTGSGWDQLALYRKQADTPWFQSFLAFDPARIMPDVRQPLLIVQGKLDTQVAPTNADRLQALAAARKKTPPVQVVKVPGINHLLVPATTGEADEYAKLEDKHVSAEVSKAIVTWLQATLTK